MLQPRIRPPRTSLSSRCLYLTSSRTAQSFDANTQISRSFTSTLPSHGPDVQTERSLPSITTATGSIPSDTSARPRSDTVNQGLWRPKPRTPGLRHLVRPINNHLWKGRPLLPLTFPKKGQGKGGRNNTGRITVRHRGGGHKRRIRTVDFYRQRPGKMLVERVEYDPNRSAHIALVRPPESTKMSDYAYILAAEGMRAGDVVESYRAGIPDDLMESMGGKVDYGVLASKTAWRGNCLPLGMIPVGTQIYAIGLKADGPAKYCRSAGTYGIVTGKGEDAVKKEIGRIIEKEGSRRVGDMKQARREELRKLQKLSQLVTVKLSSGEVRNIPIDACATIGVASNVNHQYAQLGKAGRARWLGWRPTVRGVAMNAVDHPHGGGRGKGKGNRDPVSPTGKPVSFFPLSVDDIQYLPVRELC